MLLTASNLMRALVMAFAVVTCGACAAKTSDTPSAWKDDCVGRMQISLPREVEVAVTSKERMDAEMEITRYKNEPEYSFQDGTSAGYTHLGYTGGDTLISEVAEKSQLRQWISAHQTKVLPDVQKSVKGKWVTPDEKYDAKAVTLKSPLSSAYKLYGTQHDLITVVGERAIKTAITTHQDNEVSSISYIDSLPSKLAKRR